MGNAPPSKLIGIPMYDCSVGVVRLRFVDLLSNSPRVPTYGMKGKQNCDLTALTRYTKSNDHGMTTRQQVQKQRDYQVSVDGHVMVSYRADTLL